MKNYTKDIILSIIPLLLYHILSQFEINYNAWKQSVSISNSAKECRVNERIPVVAFTHRASREYCIYHCLFTHRAVGE